MRRYARVLMASTGAVASVLIAWLAPQGSQPLFRAAWLVYGLALAIHAGLGYRRIRRAANASVRPAPPSAR